MFREESSKKENLFIYNNKQYIDFNIIILLFQMLDIQSLARMESASLFFRTFIISSNIWRQILVHHFPEKNYLIFESAQETKQLLKKLDGNFFTVKTELTKNYKSIARAIRYGDFSDEYVGKKSPSFFDVVQTSISENRMYDSVIHDAIYRCKDQGLLNSVYHAQFERMLDRETGMIDVHVRSRAGFQILHYACICNQPVETIKDLIGKGANYNKACVCYPKYTPLSLAAIGGRNEIIQYLLLYKDIQIFGVKDIPLTKTPLYFAVVYHEIDSINLLLGDKRNQNVVALEVPFRFAINNGMESIVKIFIKLCPDIINHSNDHQNGTPLCDAIVANQNKIFDLLIQEGANVKLAGKNGDTPLHIAIRTEKFTYAEKLIEKGADINIHGKDNLKPIHIAMENYRVSGVHFLLLHGAEQDTNDLNFGLDNSIEKYFSTLDSAKAMLNQGCGVIGVAISLLDEYLSPKSLAGKTFNLKGGSARFLAGKSKLLYIEHAKVLFKDVSHQDSSVELIKQRCEELLKNLDEDYRKNYKDKSYKKFYAIIAVLHLLSSSLPLNQVNTFRMNKKLW